MESASFAALLICVITVPLIFTEYIENGFELTKAVALRVTGGLLVLTSLLYILIRRTHKDHAGFGAFIDRAMDPAVFFFIFAAVVTTVFSLNPYVSYYGSYERQIGLVTYIAAFCIYFISTGLIAENDRLNKLVVSMELAAVIVSVYSFMQVLGLDPFYVPLTDHRASATFAHSIFAGGFLVLVFPFSLTRALQNHHRYYLFLVPLFIASAIVITKSRAPYVALIAEVLVIVLANAFMFRGDSAKFKRLIRVSAIVAASVLVIVTLLILFVKGNPFIDRLASVLQITESARWLLWRDSFKAFALHPWLGSGIAEFSNTFEYLISPELKKVSIFSIYDNAHNNYLQVLCTMGLLGILAYLTMIFQAARLTLKTVLSQSVDGPAKYLMLSCFAAICGYMVFGLADFDDTSIILYVFLIFSIVRFTYSRLFKGTFEIQKLKIPAYTAAVFAGAFSVYSIFTAYPFLKADSFYQDAKAEYVAGNFGATVKMMNNAVTLNYGCAEYKYMLAGFVYDYCVKNPALNPSSKNSLLKQAEEELERAKPNINSLLKFKALMAVILLEQGRTGEGEQLKDEVFKADSISVQLRNNLARYYFAKEDYPKMLSELMVIYRNHPGDVDASLTNMAYYLKIGDYQKAFWCCEYVIKCQPSNEKAKKVLEELKVKLKQTPAK